MKDGKGYIFFEDGEIIHAQYGKLEGERAVLKLLALSEGSIAVKNIQSNKIKRTMELPFVEQIMNIMKTIDEINRDQKKSSEEKPKKEKESRMAFDEKLSILKEVNGYLGAGVFTPQGEILEGASDISDIQFEEAGALIHDTLKNSKAMAKEIGFGNLDMIQLYTPVGIVFAKCHQEGNSHFHTILVIKTDGNITMARLKLNQVVELLVEEF
jgi:roadblock/LC7 domain-containing protein